MLSRVMKPPSAFRDLSNGEAKALPLGDRIRWARIQKGLSHDKLAAQVKTTRSHLIKLEKNMHRPGPELRARIAEATDQPLEFLDDDEEEDAYALFRAAMDERTDLVLGLLTEIKQLLMTSQKEAA